MGRLHVDAMLDEIGLDEFMEWEAWRLLDVGEPVMEAKPPAAPVPDAVATERMRNLFGALSSLGR